MGAKIKHFIQVPFTGLGLYGGYRGDDWLKNRIRLFKEYVIPSLMNQSNRNFVLWVCWRPEEKDNPIVRDFADYLNHFSDLDFIFTYQGIMFWDDKYPEQEAYNRLNNTFEKTLPLLKQFVDGTDWVLVTLQPSDDCYLYNTIQRLQEEDLKQQAIGFKRGYIMDVFKKELSEYNPDTTPPFYTVYFPTDIFLDPKEHMKYIGRCKSHEYVKNFLPYKLYEDRGFIVNCHTENISTGYNIPYKGRKLTKEQTGDVLRLAGVSESKPLKLTRHWKRYYFKLPHWLRRKMRYYFGEKFYAKIVKG